MPILPIILLASAAVYPQPAFSVDAALGYNGFFRRGTWTPVQVTVENLGSLFEGEIRLEVRQSDPLSVRKSTYARHIELPANSRKRVRFVIPLEDDFQRVTVGIHGEGGTIEQIPLELGGRGLTNRLILGLSREVPLDFLSLLPPVGAPGITVIYPHIQLLPDRWYAYQGIEAVVLHDTALTQLTEQQLQALDTWLWLGGNLIVSGGAHFSRKEAEWLQRLLPVEVNGLIEVNGLSSLVHRFGGGAEGHQSTMMTDSRALGGQVLVWEDGIPVIVRQNRGRGVVTFLAFDFSRPPFYGWEGLMPLWRFLLGEEPADTQSEYRQFSEERVIQGIRQSTVVAAPSPLWALLLLAAYLGCLTLVFLPLRKTKQPKRTFQYALLLLISMATSTAGASLFYSRVLAKTGAAVDLSVIQMKPGAEQNLLSRYTWVLSSRDKRYDFLIAYGPAAVEISGTDDTLIREEDSRAFAEIFVDKWDEKWIHTAAPVELSLDASIRQRDNRLELNLKNTSSRDLQRCFFFHRGEAYYFGTLERGGELSESFRLDRATVPLGRVLPEELARNDETAPLKEAVLSLVRGESAAAERTTVLFTGWMEQPIFPVPVDAPPGLESRMLSLAVLEIKTDLADPPDEEGTDAYP